MQKIILLGSGALKIGEAGEFDYSGTQAIKALKEENKKIILVNPNVATIQTSKGLADQIYFLPVNAYFVEKIIQKEKPDGILLSFGGQTALNCGIELYQKGILNREKVKILGTPIQAIIDTEDRKIFSQKLKQIGLKTAYGKIIKTVQEAINFAQIIKYPVMIRAGFALGGTGSGVAKNDAELTELVSKALATSGQIVIEEDLTGWKEIEYEVVRDKNNNCLTVCNMENFDPVGIHTGESIVIAPSQTLNNSEYYSFRQISINTICELKIVGECNIQFAINPENSDYRIIEVNARLSRSSALASKATGYPLAYIACKLALGKTLPELTNSITKKTTSFFEPALDYVVIKIPRWDLDKFQYADSHIGSEMKSVGEVMSIGRNFYEAIQKAVRMLNIESKSILNNEFLKFNKKQLLEKIKNADANRLFYICSALYKGISIRKINQITKIDNWFLEKLLEIAKVYLKIKKTKILNKELLILAKKFGFSDRQIAECKNQSEFTIRNLRKKYQITPFIKNIDTLAGEFPAKTNYLYLTYQASKHDYIPSKNTKKISVIGSGPYAVGTSVEFDWCAVNTVIRLRELGYQSIMINCNPETVSTDYDYSDFLYFEELTLERILDIYDLEKAPFILSVGGQIPNNLACKLAKYKIPLLGSDAEKIKLAENRHIFSHLLDKLHISQAPWGKAHSTEQTLKLADKLGYPIIIRPSFVISGQAISVIESKKDLIDYMDKFKLNPKEHPLIISKFIYEARECDFDGVSKNGNIITSCLSEHLEHGGVHSGDATMFLPQITLSKKNIQAIYQTAQKIVAKIKINGPFNIQFLLKENELFIIECNLRASRSFPFASKTYNTNFIKIATDIALGKKIQKINLNNPDYQAVKAPQFSFHKLRGADPVLRVEMSSTGEVAAFGSNKYESYLKAIMSVGINYPVKKSVFLSLGGKHGKVAFLKSLTYLKQMNYKIFATSATSLFLNEIGFSNTKVGKFNEGYKPNYHDLLKNKSIDFAIVIPEKGISVISYFPNEKSEGRQMRRMAVDLGIPIITNIENANFFIESLANCPIKNLEIKPWQNYIKN